MAQVNGRSLTAISAALLTAACFGFAHAAQADVCAPVKKAGVQARPYRLLVNGQERMVHTAGTNYFRVGATWRRAPANANTQLASLQATYMDCKVIGHERINGVATTAYRYTMHYPSLPDRQDKMWVGTADGLVYRLAPGGGGGVEDFDYMNVLAPPV